MIFLLSTTGLLVLSTVIQTNRLETDVVVCGGGLAGVCAAVSAARHRADVVLIQDRPVLGGNSSSEIRVGIKGARGNDDKETGILEELELENPLTMTGEPTRCCEEI